MLKFILFIAQQRTITYPQQHEQLYYNDH